MLKDTVRRLDYEEVLTGMAHAAAQMQIYIIIFIFIMNSQCLFGTKNTTQKKNKVKDDKHSSWLFQSLHWPFPGTRREN